MSISIPTDGAPAGRTTASGQHLRRDRGDTAPSYRITIAPSPKRVKVVFNGTMIADSSKALVMHETRLAPIYYLPRDDVRMEHLERTEHHTHCPFKGNAAYWTIRVGDKAAENAVWSYEQPLEEAAPIKGYMAFYWNKVDVWYEEDSELAIDAAATGHEHGNRFVDWLLREAWDATTSEELVGRLGQRLVEADIPLMRLVLVIRTLHPEVLANAYSWRRDEGVREPYQLRHIRAQTPEFLNSPFVPIFNGAGGIRRRLDVPEPKLDYPILEDLMAEGATDYVAMPLKFSDGQINVVTFATDRPGGFTTDELGEIYEILPVLSRLFEVHAMRLTTRYLLDTYIGQHTGAQVLHGLVKRGDGENIPAVIWMCDLRGSTAMADNQPRDAYLALLNEFFDCTAGAVLEHGGEVLKFIGDGVLAIFPIQAWSGGDGAAPDANGETTSPAAAMPNACTRAIRAAHAAKARVAALNETLTADGKDGLRFVTAVHQGDVTYGNIGVAGRLDFTVIGPTANEAARLTDIAKSLDQSVVLSEQIAANVTEPLQSLGRHCLRGVGAEQEVFTFQDGV